MILLKFPHDPLSIFGLVMLIVLILLGLFGPYLPIGHPSRIGAAPRLDGPSWAHPFGVDELSRAYLPRVVEGIRATFIVSIIAVAITAVIGRLLGMVAGYRRGIVDGLVAQLADIIFAFPALLLGLLVAAVAGPGAASALAVICIATLPLFIRVVHAVTLSVAKRGFVVAAEVAGASTWRIMLVHILPNILGPAIVQLTYALSIAMIIESALSFLGLGVQPPDTSLGSLLRQSSTYLIVAPWLVLSAGAILLLAIMSVNLVGDAIRDGVEPLKGRSLT